MSNEIEYATFVFKRGSNIYNYLIENIPNYINDGSFGSVTAEDLNEKCEKLEEYIKQLEQ